MNEIIGNRLGKRVHRHTPMVESRSMLAHSKRKGDKRRKHHHYQAKVFYRDGETFARTYTDRRKAESFAERERKSPVVKMARVTEVNKPA